MNGTLVSPPHARTAGRTLCVLQPQVTTFGHCVIAVSDWEQSNAVYRDVLGAEAVRVGDGFAYRFGADQLNIHGPGVDGEPNARPPVAPGRRPKRVFPRSGRSLLELISYA